MRPSDTSRPSSPQPLLARGRCRLVSLALPRCGRVHLMLLPVVPKVAALAQRRQVGSLPVSRVVIEMRHSEDNPDDLGLTAEPPL